MLKRLSMITIMASITLFLVACDKNNVDTDTDTDTTATAKKVEGRWYTTAQIIRGKKVFKNNCAACHGDKGQGLVSDWKKADASGKFPAPPLNGTAHTWHHSKGVLMRTVNKGGIALGGTMPPFKAKLAENKKEAVLAYVMSLWNDDIYNAWIKRNPH